jgi:hypothetical protein
MSRLHSALVYPATLLGVFLGCVYLLTGSSDLLHNGDTLLRYQTTQAIVDSHQIWLAHPRYLDTRVARGLGGHLYAFYAPGQIILMVPFYVVGKFLAHHLNLPYDTTTIYACRSLDLLLGAGLGVLFFLFAVTAGFATRVAVLLTLIFGLATVAWPDAQSGLEQTQVNFFLLFGSLGLWKFVRFGMSERQWLVLGGAGLGLAVFTRYDALIYLPLLAAYLAFLRWRGRDLRSLARDLIVLGAGAAPFLAAVALWNILRFGSPFTTGLHEATLGNPVFLGLAELTVSPGKGLVWYLPLVLLLPWCAPRFARRLPDLALLCALLVVLPLVFYANILYWHGDPAWGPRYLYVAVPYLILPLGEILASWRTRPVALRAASVALVAAGLTLSLAAVSVTQWRFWYHLQATQEAGSNAATWSGQPFQWGAQHYHYYWKLAESPILIQLQDVYEVGSLVAGDEHYRLVKKAGSLVHSNPANLYPVNSLAFWWVDPHHPLLGPRARGALAAGLGAGALVMLLALLALLRRPGETRALRPERQIAGAQSLGG